MFVQEYSTSFLNRFLFKFIFKSLHSYLIIDFQKILPPSPVHIQKVKRPPKFES